MSTDCENSAIRDPQSPFQADSAIRILIRQFLAIFLLSLRRLLFSRFAISIGVLSAMPIGIGFLIVCGHNRMSIQEFHTTLEVLLRILYLHFIVFFGANVLGFAVVRQEIDDLTLHYLFLQPIPRWLLVVGKALAFLTLASAACVASLWLTYLVTTLPCLGFGAVVSDLFGKGRFVILLKESFVIVLGLLAYGSVAMLMGSLFKSAFYALILLAWESGLPYLPSMLKMWTVMHYLQSLLPERHTDLNQMFVLLGEPAPVWLSLCVTIGVPCCFLAACALYYQFRECLYAEA